MDSQHLSAPSAPAITPDPASRDNDRQPAPYALVTGPAATVGRPVHVPSSERPSQRAYGR
jgi:hypothetical protein